MTIDIDEVIQEHLHLAEMWQEKFDKKTWAQRHIGGCDKEAEKHRQIAEWLKELKKKEEINQSLLYENERLLKSVQEIKDEIDERSDIVKRDNIYYAEGLEEALSIIDKHMNWEGEK